jgi:hypothetical protein
MAVAANMIDVFRLERSSRSPLRHSHPNLLA